ncbi:MAG TPA: polyprenyl synthetase family protein [Methylomusa anaerophila]|uniref:Heptaprenyl diphosphate synthase component 2 n=1 Tax=Methylomusa anaerophila TaxID=1930071 RepID=A0A348AFK4_9FIRM|nr:polyprenyl synthetase family protein [Methylomusa anaerophila]BBB89852.1 heptaprenyl diphosphate synthase component 2 [Methylomusa anaerophila]HML89102.1 polyprenyl synthetase family protein [Methylomusa anaerophila]
MSKFPKNLLKIVEPDLAAVEKELSLVIQSPVDLVNEIGLHLVKAGGKRLRPALYLLCAHSGPSERNELIPMAVALELIHMATLVHDDVIDNASLRRGKPTANARWGNHSSVLTGDYLWAKAFSVVATTVDVRKLTILTHVICSMCEGEIIQLQESHNPDRTEDDYRLRVSQKTADFIAACCTLGALSANLSNSEIAAFQEYGYSIGMAFQITDDILDFVASSEQLGKPAGNDLRQGIVTLPIIFALRHSVDRDELRVLIKDENMSYDKVNRGLDIVLATGAIEYCYSEVQRYLETAKSVLPPHIPAGVREALVAIADYIGFRQN